MGFPLSFLEDGFNAEVLRGAKGIDLCLAVDDQPDSNALYAASTEAGNAGLPSKQRRDLPAEQAVFRAACGLGADEVHVELPR